VKFSSDGVLIKFTQHLMQEYSRLPVLAMIAACAI